jgi:death-on-curing protein
MFSLTNNHAFVDGNKRIGVFTMLMTLQLNNIKINYTQSELILFGLSVAEGKTEYIEILDWIMEHKL